MSVKTASHNPFLLRVILVALAAIIAFGVEWFFLFERNLWGVPNSGLLGIAAYCCLVTFFDIFSHSVLRLKSSIFANPARLLKEEGVTQQQLDAYFDTQRWIRLVSLSTAFLGGCITFVCSLPQVLLVFCGIYSLVTLLGVLYVRLFTHITSPKKFHDVDLSLVRRGPMPGFITLEQRLIDRFMDFPDRPVDSSAPFSPMWSLYLPPSEASSSDSGNCLGVCSTDSKS